MANIYKTALKFKAELLRLDAQAMRRLAQAHAAAWTSLHDSFEAMTTRIEAAMLAGEEFSPSWLSRQLRYHQLTEQLEKQMFAYSLTAAEIATDAQRRASVMAEMHAAKLTEIGMGKAPAPGLTIAWNRVPEDALRNMIGYLGDGSPLAYKFNGLAIAVAEEVKSILTTGVVTGVNPRVLARQINKTSDGALLNSLTVCRTETLRAYRQASHASYEANSDIVTGWIWLAARQARTCAACWAMDGTEHPLSEMQTDHPRGRCTAIPLVKTYAELFPDTPGVENVTETGARGWDSEEAFARLSDKDKLAVLGPKRFELYQSGTVKLKDMAHKVKSRTWGDHYGVKPLSEVEGK